MKLGKRIEELLDKHRRSQAELARHVGVSPQAVGHWINDGAEPRGAAREKIAEFFGITEEELIFGNLRSVVRVRRIPVISWARAVDGPPTVAEDAPGFSSNWFAVAGQMGKHAFGLEVVDDTMANPNGSPSFPPGTTIVVDPDLEAVSGDYVIAHSKGASEPTFKQLVLDGRRRYLRPLNPRYPIAEMTKDDRVIGVVREFGARIR